MMPPSSSAVNVGGSDDECPGLASSEDGDETDTETAGGGGRPERRGGAPCLRRRPASLPAGLFRRVCCLAAVGAIVAPVTMGAARAVASVGQAPGQLTSLDSLPWERMAEPPSGYQHRTVVECAGRPTEILVDTGAAFSFVFEEVVLAILNQAITDGLTSESPDWPLAGLYEWGYDSPANSAAQAGRWDVRGIAVLRITFVGLDVEGAGAA